MPQNTTHRVSLFPTLSLNNGNVGKPNANDFLYTDTDTASAMSSHRPSSLASMTPLPFLRIHTKAVFEIPES